VVQRRVQQEDRHLDLFQSQPVVGVRRLRLLDRAADAGHVHERSDPPVRLVKVPMPDPIEALSIAEAGDSEAFLPVVKVQLLA